jgi:hypothetical protein
MTQSVAIVHTTDGLLSSFDKLTVFIRVAFLLPQIKSHGLADIHFFV